MWLLGFQLFNLEIPLAVVFLIGIIAVFIIWKLIKFAIKILIVIIIFFLILFGLDLIGVFSHLPKIISMIT